MSKFYTHKYVNDDNFTIYYVPSDTYNTNIYSLFNIKAGCGIAVRICPTCGKYNAIDGYTWDNYAEYVNIRNVREHFAVKFWFDCKHPIEPMRESELIRIIGMNGVKINI